MKLKNNEPGKIWTKSDHRFQSYDHITVVKGPSRCWEQLPETRPGTRVIAFQYPENRVIYFTNTRPNPTPDSFFVLQTGRSRHPHAKPKQKTEGEAVYPHAQEGHIQSLDSH